MIEDLALETEEDNRPRLPGLAVPSTADDRELRIREYAYRMFPDAAATELIFTTENEETGEEQWEATIVTDRVTGIETTRRLEAEVWQKLMSWPREPTIEEAMASKANAMARAGVALWSALQRGSPEDRAYLSDKLG
jgi:hypothetical protein